MKSYKDCVVGEPFDELLSPRFGVRTLLHLLLLVMVLFLIMIVFIHWTPVVYGSGRVIALNPNSRQQMIEAPIAGRILEWYVTEGMPVKKGEHLARIVDIDPSRLSRLKEKLDATNRELSALKEHEKRAALHVERVKALYQKGIESKRELELAEIDLYKVQSDIQALVAKQQEAESSLARQSSQDVLAPLGGTIMKILATENSDVIKVGEYIAKIVPTNVDLAAELTIPGRDLPLIHQGQTVRLSFEGWPSVQIVGWPSLAVGTFPGKIRIIDQGDDGKGNFRIVVVPVRSPKSQEQWPASTIRMGSRVEGWIQMQTVPLWWEIWRLFSGMPPLSPAVKSAKALQKK